MPTANSWGDSWGEALFVPILSGAEEVAAPLLASSPSFSFPALRPGRADQLASVLGTFWLNDFAQAEDVRHYVAAVALAYQRSERSLREAVSAVSFTGSADSSVVPWRPLTLRPSTRAPYVAAYGDAGLLFGGGLTFGGNEANWWAWELPAGLLEAPWVAARPGVADCLARGTDYVVDVRRGVLAFRSDPFQDNRLVRGFPVPGGEPEVRLWLAETVGTAKGLAAWRKAVGATSASQEELAGLWFASVRGGSYAAVTGALQAVTGALWAQADGEQVVYVGSDVRGLVIATTRAVYRYGPGAAALVDVGASLLAGQPLTDALLVARAGRPAPSWLRAISLGEDFLQGNYASELVFAPGAVPLEVTSDADGFTRVAFALGGAAQAQQDFWDEAHRRGRAAGTTLAMLLDRRTDPVGQPDAASLPATIDPLQFFLTNVFACHALLVQVKVAALPGGVAGLSQFRFVRERMPPEDVLFVTVGLPENSEAVTITGPDALDSWSGAETTAELAVAGPPAIGGWLVPGP